VRTHRFVSNVLSNSTSNNPEPPAPAAPSPEQILAELEQIVKSETFAGAARQQRLLRHLVTKRLNGSLGDLKEYTLGVEVFDRGDDFDPRMDPIVRVEASRLRSRLQKYYAGPGTSDPLRIALPRGAYVPSFAEPAAPEPVNPVEIQTPAVLAAEPVSAPIPVAGSRYRRVAVIALALACAGAALWIGRRIGGSPPAPHYARFKRITNDEVLCTSPSFAPDDRTIAYAERDAGTWHLYERDLSTSARTELTPGSDDDDYQPAWSPDGRSIAFRSEREGGGLFLLDAQTRAVSRLTNLGYNPAWSPDGRRLAFSTGTFTDPVETSAGGSALEVLDLSTRTIEKVAVPAASAWQPAWSPHGHRIAYWDTEANGDRDIWTVDADRHDNPARAVAVMHDAWTDWSPAWSADGDYLYFSSDRNGAMTLWRVPINEKSGAVSGNLEPVTTPSSYTGWATFARSGKEFAYVRRIPFSELYKAAFDPDKGLDLATKLQLTEGERGMHEPDMSPDGKWIALRIQDPQEDLALIRPNGSNLKRLTNDLFSDRSPHWSPDGKQIIFTSNRSRRFELWSIHPDGTGLRQLTQHGMMSYAWTPDGTLTGYPPNRPPVALDPANAPVKDWGLPQVFRPLAWSPDKQAIVGRMRSSAFGSESLFIYTPATEDYWEIAPAAANPSTVWMPHDDKLLFSRSEGIYLADVHTHQVKQETPTARSDIHSRFTMSPDRRTFFFVQSDDQEDIWTGSE
jgi:eukaryotic-like serine/threonine-protein kinase